MSASRLALVLASLVAVLSGCAAGSHHRPTPAQPIPNLPQSATPAVSHAPVGASSLVPAGRLMIRFQRVTGYDPWASELSVNRRGQAVAVETVGGMSGQKRHTFTLSPTVIRHLRQLIDHAHLRDTWCCSARSYMYILYIDGHAWRLQQGHLTTSMKPLIAELNAITNVHTIWNS
jgi:hypothetical protein